jgi:hypothetical protein
MKYIKQIFDLFRPQSQQEWIESYLAQSVSLYDLEARQRELMRKGIY